MNSEVSKDINMRWMRPYGALLIVLSLVVVALMSGDGDLEDILLWVLSGLFIIAGGLLVSGRAVRALFIPIAIVGILGACYSILVWGVSFLFARSTAFGSDMITMLVIAIATIIYLVVGLVLFARKRIIMNEAVSDE